MKEEPSVDMLRNLGQWWSLDLKLHVWDYNLSNLIYNAGLDKPTIDVVHINVLDWNWNFDQ